MGEEGQNSLPISTPGLPGLQRFCREQSALYKMKSEFQEKLLEGCTTIYFSAVFAEFRLNFCKWMV